MTWQRIDENIYIDDTLVTCAEYQLFIDEMRDQGKYYQPDHWTSYQFPKGNAKQPVLGVRYSDAIAFCEWLTKRQGEEWVYRLPTLDEIKNHKLSNTNNLCWTSPPRQEIVSLQKYQLEKLLTTDGRLLGDMSYAYKLLKIKPIPTSELINDDYLHKKNQSPGQGLLSLQESGLLRLRYKMTLNKSIQFASLLKLNYEAILPASYDFLLEMQNFNKYLQHLDNRRLSFQLLDISKSALEFLDLLIRITNYADYPIKLKPISDELIQATNVFQERGWVNYQKYYYDPDIKDMYHFLRWYIRILILYFLGLVSESNTQYLKGNKDQLERSAQTLLFSLANLERMINGVLPIGCGLQIVKEAKGA